MRLKLYGNQLEPGQTPSHLQGPSPRLVAMRQEMAARQAIVNTNENEMEFEQEVLSQEEIDAANARNRY